MLFAGTSESIFVFADLQVYSLSLRMESGKDWSWPAGLNTCTKDELMLFCFSPGTYGGATEALERGRTE